MAATKYSLPIQCKVKVGKMVKFPCVIGYFANDDDAESARSMLEAMLGNFAKVGLNKTIVAVGNEEIGALPMDTVEDVIDANVACYHNDSGKKKGYLSIQIPGLKADVTDEQIANFVKKFHLEYGDAELQVNAVQRINKYAVNVKAGGLTSESVVPKEIP